MKFTSKFAVSALMLALSSSWAWAGLTTQPLETQVTKLNSIKSDSSVATDAGIKEEDFKLLQRVIKDDYFNLDNAGKLAYLQKAKERLEQVVKTYETTSTSNQAAETAKKTLALLEKPEDVIKQEALVQTQATALRNYPLEVDLLQRQLELQPLLHSQAQHLALQAADAQLHVTLLQDLTRGDASGVFGLSHGVVTKGDGISVRANQLALGYKLSTELLNGDAGVTGAIFGDLLTADAKSNFGKQEFTFKHHAVFGGGVYGALRHGDFQLATLGALSQGGEAVNAFADHSGILSKLSDTDVAKKLAPSQLTQAKVSAQSRTLNYLLGASYTLAVQSGLVVTPSVFYHFHSYLPQGEKVTFVANGDTDEAVVKHQAAVLELSKKSAFIPRLTQHGVGGTLAVDYAIDRQFSVGADASAVYYRGTLLQGTAAVVERERAVDGVAGAQEKYRTAEVVWQEQPLNHITMTGAVRASYAFTPNLQLQAKLGYSHTTQRNQSGLNYGLNLGIKF